MTGVTFIVSHQGRVFKDLLRSRVYPYYWLPKQEVLGQGYLLLLVAGVTFVSGYEYEGKDTYFIYYSKDGMREVLLYLGDWRTPFLVSYAAAFRLSDVLLTPPLVGGRALMWAARGGW